MYKVDMTDINSVEEAFYNATRNLSFEQWQTIHKPLSDEDKKVSR